MLLSFMLMVTFILVDCKILEKRHVPNCVDPQQPVEVYNLDGWIGQLHLQQCVLVAIGENFYAVFLEKRPRPYDANQEIKDYFLGICDYRTIKKWNFCPLALDTKRREDCAFKEDSQASPRVHRRFCELSDLTQFGEQCNCDSVLRGDKLFRVTGFPTCFRPQMQETVCGYNNVCGLNGCSMSLVANRVYLVKCDENCFGHKPFCENPEWESSKPREVTSFWTDWSEAKCADSECLAQYNEANCISKDTGLGDVDCLGPGSSCCTTDLVDCKCHVFVEEGMSKVIRTFTVPVEPDYDELSLDEIIKNLPVRNEHRQYKFRDKIRSRQKMLRRHSMRDETYDDTYDHAYNVKLIKDNIHAKVRDKQEQKAERDWLQQKARNSTKKVSPRLARPENVVEPNDFFFKDFGWFNASCFSPNARRLKATEKAQDESKVSATAQVRRENVPSMVRYNPSILPGQYWIEPYSKQSLFRKKMQKSREGDLDHEEIEDDTDEQLKQLEQDDAEADDDIMIEEIDVKTTTTTEGYEPDEIRAVQIYESIHKNGSAAIDELDQNATRKADSGGILFSYSKTAILSFILLCLGLLE